MSSLFLEIKALKIKKLNYINRYIKGRYHPETYFCMNALQTVIINSIFNNSSISFIQIKV